MPIKKDLGQDATASALIPVRHDDRDYSFAFSLTPTFQKLKDDCHRRKEMGHSFHVLVFTVCGEVTASNRKDWLRFVSDTYGWSLIIHDMNFLLNEAELKENDDLIADELNVKRSEVFAFTENVSGQASLMVDNLSPQTRLHMYNRDDFDHLVRNSIDLAIQQREAWRFDDAINTLEASLSRFSDTLSRSDTSRIYANIGANYYDKGDQEVAGNFFDLALEKDDNSYHNHLNKIIYMLSKGDCQDAIALLDQIEIRFGSNADTHNLFACIYHDQGRDDEARERLENAISLDATHANALTNMGLFARRRGDLGGSLELFSKACTLDNNNHMAHALRLETESHMAMEKLSDIAPISLITEIRYCIGRLVNGRYPPPKMLDISIAVFYSALGLAYLAIGDPLLASECFRDALRYQDNYVMHVNLGMSMMRCDNRQVAEDEFREAVSRGCRMPKVLYNIAICDIMRFFGNNSVGSDPLTEASSFFEEIRETDDEKDEVDFLEGSLIYAWSLHDRSDRGLAHAEWIFRRLTLDVHCPKDLSVNAHINLEGVMRLQEQINMRNRRYRRRSIV